jgi:hypothetical protein
MMPARQPWPAPTGAANDGNTPVTFAGGSATRWTVELGERLAECIVADAEGRWFAMGPGFVIAGDRAERWRYQGRAFRPCLLDDGLLVLPRCENGLVTVRPENGAEAWTAPGEHVYVAPVGGGGLITCESRDSDWFLVGFDPGGAIRRSRLAGAPVGPPLALPEGAVVSASRRTIEAFDRRGEVLWAASPDGFDAPPHRQHEFTTAAVGLESGRLAVGTDAYEWRGYLILDPARRSAAPWPPHGWIAPDAEPLAVRPFPPPEALVTRLQATMLVTAVDGEERREHALPTRPYAYAVDPRGRIAVGYTHTAQYHDRYKGGDPDRLPGRCGVALFEADGRRLWTWDAPGPLGGFAVSAAGEILVTSEGRLWAIA